MLSDFFAGISEGIVFDSSLSDFFDSTLSYEEYKRNRSIFIDPCEIEINVDLLPIFENKMLEEWSKKLGQTLERKPE